MKIKGKKIDNPYEEVVVFPRGTSDPLVFTVRAVLDEKAFFQLCPSPVPPRTAMAGQITASGQPLYTENVEHPDFKKAAAEHWTRRQNWRKIQSLMATEGLEFEMVKLDDPMTWQLLEDELKSAKLTFDERWHLFRTIEAVNGMSTEKLDSARESFLQKRAAEASASTFRAAAPIAMPSGEPANPST